MCLVPKDYIQCGSGPRAAARARPLGARHWEETVVCSAWLVSRPGLLLTGLRVGSPGPSCVSRLRHSDRQLASCWQGAHRSPTPLLSYWAASGTWSREKKKDTDENGRLHATTSHLEHLPLLERQDSCHTEEARDTLLQFPAQH